jgi:alpha-tubulin suppressor-like RCC1 family protein
MSSVRVTTNFKDDNGTDLGDKLVTKDYLISVYPEISQQIGIPPELWTWGLGSSGQLGDATITDVSTPVTTFAGGSSWKQVSSVGALAAAIKTDGTLWTWGNGIFGNLGNASTTNRSTPVTTFAGGTNWKFVSSSNNHITAIKTDGTLWTWGLGNFGNLGNASTTNRSTPVTTFAGGTDWKQVSAGNNHTSAIKTDGTLWTWGNGLAGQLGDATLTNKSTPVTTFSGGNNWKQISARNEFMGAIKTDGTLWTWGNGLAGQLGNESITNRSTPVTTFAGGNNWKQLSVAGNFVAAIKTDGTLWTWGLGANGRLGNADTTNRSTPVTTFAGGTNWKQVSGGGNATSVIKTDGTLWTWGAGSSGQLGNFAAANRSTPVTTFAGGTNWKQVNVGGSHMVAIRSVDF